MQLLDAWTADAASGDRSSSGSGPSGHDIECRLLAGKRLLTGQQLSDFGLLSHLERVIYLDAKISNCALELRMA